MHNLELTQEIAALLESLEGMLEGTSLGQASALLLEQIGAASRVWCDLYVVYVGGQKFYSGFGTDKISVISYVEYGLFIDYGLSTWQSVQIMVVRLLHERNGGYHLVLEIFTIDE